MVKNEQRTVLTPHEKQQKKERFWFLSAIMLFMLVAFLVFSYLSRNNMLPTVAQEPAPTVTPVASQNIIVSTPTIDERVSQNFQVKGKARVFENILSLRIKHKLTGKIYRMDTTTAYAPDTGMFGDFVYTANIAPDFSLRSGDELILEVFQFSPKDGSEIDKVTIPLKFTPVLD